MKKITKQLALMAMTLMVSATANAQYITEAPAGGFNFNSGKDYIVIFVPEEQKAAMGNKIISDQNLDPTQTKNWFSYWTADWDPKLFTLFDCPNKEKNSWGGDIKLNMTPLFPWGAGDFTSKEGYTYDLSAVTDDHYLHIGFMNIGSETSKPCFKFQLGPSSENGFSLEVNQPVGEMLGDYSGVGYARGTHKWFYLDIPIKDLIDEYGDFGFFYDFSEPITKAFSCGFDIQPADESSSVTTYTQGAVDPETGMYTITVTELKSALAVDHVFLYKKDATGISETKGSRDEVVGEARQYNLSGQKVGNGYRGIVVQDGKKVLR